MEFEARRFAFRRYGASMPGLVRIDRAILYIKQRISNVIGMLEAKDTKGVGDAAYSVQGLVREMARLLAMSGYEACAERMVMLSRDLSSRTPRAQGIEMLKSFVAEIESYPGAQEEGDVEALRDRIDVLEQELGEEGGRKPHPTDTSKQNTVFVIMPFKPEFNDVWKGGILRAAKAESFTAIRVDMINRSTNITDDIVESVDKCRLAIVDVTGNNPNVMFELGYAVARAKPNIIISQSVDYLPFDIRNIRTIVYANTWSGIEELKAKIEEFLNEYSAVSTKAARKKAPTSASSRLLRRG